MLHERKARSVSYDPRAKTARVELGEGRPAEVTSRAEGTALLDARGGLVGVDLGEGGSAGRVVVMHGPHEAVASTRSARLTVTTDAQGEVLAIVVHDVQPA